VDFQAYPGSEDVQLRLGFQHFHFCHHRGGFGVEPAKNKGM
jgi:hypothetical protein